MEQFQRVLMQRVTFGMVEGGGTVFGPPGWSVISLAEHRVAYDLWRGGRGV